MRHDHQGDGGSCSGSLPISRSPERGRHCSRTLACWEYGSCRSSDTDVFAKALVRGFATSAKGSLSTVSDASCLRMSLARVSEWFL